MKAYRPNNHTKLRPELYNTHAYNLEWIGRLTIKHKTDVYWDEVHVGCVLTVGKVYYAADVNQKNRKRCESRRHALQCLIPRAL